MLLALAFVHPRLLCAPSVSFSARDSGLALTPGAAIADRVNTLADAPLLFHDVSGLGPTAAIEKLKESMPSDSAAHARWLSEARVAAILGSCPRSRESFRSGLRNYIRFAKVAFGGGELGFPPSVDTLLLWSHNFRCVVRFSLYCCLAPRSGHRWQGTYSNYLGRLRTACLALEVPMPPAEHPAVIRAKTSIVKRMLYSPKPRMFIQRTMVRNMFLSAERGLLTVRMAMLWLVSYLFLLRVPSEALPMIRGDSVLAQSNQSTMYLDDEGKLCLKLQRRKNRPGGSLLRRNCSGAACP